MAQKKGRHRRVSQNLRRENFGIIFLDSGELPLNPWKWTTSVLT